MLRDIPDPRAAQEFKFKSIGMVRAHNNGRRVQRKTLSDALKDARKGLTRGQRRELFIDTLFRGIKKG